MFRALRGFNGAEWRPRLLARCRRERLRRSVPVLPNSPSQDISARSAKNTPLLCTDFSKICSWLRKRATPLRGEVVARSAKRTGVFPRKRNKLSRSDTKKGELSRSVPPRGGGAVASNPSARTVQRDASGFRDDESPRFPSSATYVGLREITKLLELDAENSSNSDETKNAPPLAKVQVPENDDAGSRPGASPRQSQWRHGVAATAPRSWRPDRKGTLIRQCPTRSASEAPLVGPRGALWRRRFATAAETAAGRRWRDAFSTEPPRGYDSGSFCRERPPWRWCFGQDDVGTQFTPTPRRAFPTGLGAARVPGKRRFQAAQWSERGYNGL
jgi:hypothetical protein